MAAGCAASFGPGYTIEKQRVDVSYAKQAPDRVSIRAWYLMKNTGTIPLDALDIQLPDPEIIQPQDLQLEWHGRILPVPAPRSEISDTGLHVPLQGNWSLGDTGELVVSYHARISPDKAAVGPNGGTAFFLPSFGWLPVLMPPANRAFATGGASPPKWELVVSVPEGYQVLASGDANGRDRKGKTAGLLFTQKTGIHYDAYVAAGPYIEQQIHSSGGTVVIWSGKALTGRHATELSKAIAADASFFASEFGSPDVNKKSVWLIECPAGEPVSPERPWLSKTGCLTEPHSAVVPGTFMESDDLNEAMKSVDLQLAASWLYFSARRKKYDSIFPLGALGNYAAMSLATSRNPNARSDAVRELIHQVDAVPEKEKPLIQVDLKDSPAFQDRARAESTLFFLALEDRCGAQNVHKGIARASRLLRGETWGLPDLRSSVEAECGGPVLEGFFREWMHGTGIPAEFRARYAVAKGTQ
jgi:hypothetical protein